MPFQSTRADLAASPLWGLILSITIRVLPGRGAVFLLTGRAARTDSRPRNEAVVD